MSSRVPSQRDVAKLAGVSVASVSRYVNNKGFITDKTKQLIRKAIEELAYKPNMVARSLKMQKTDLIGLIFPDIDNLFFINLIREIEQSASTYGYNIVVCNTQNDAQREQRHLETLRGLRVSAYMIIPTLSDDPDRYAGVAKEKVLFLDRLTGREGEICLKLDNNRAVQMAMEHLFSLGHTRIGFAGVPVNITPGIERYEGYRQAIHKRALELEPGLVRIGGFSADDGYLIGKELLTVDEAPSAIVAMSELTTIGVLKACRELGFRIPEDVSIIGFDEFEWAGLLNPPLTTIAQPVDRFSEMASEILSQIISGTYCGERIISLQANLILRDSCAEYR